MSAILFNKENEIYTYMSKGILEYEPDAEALLYLSDYIVFGNYGKAYSEIKTVDGHKALGESVQAQERVAGLVLDLKISAKKHGRGDIQIRVGDKFQFFKIVHGKCVHLPTKMLLNQKAHSRSTLFIAHLHAVIDTTEILHQNVQPCRLAA